MSTYYYLCCDKCRSLVPFWGRWAGGPGTIPTARKWPDSVQDFLYDHLKHGISVASEHDVGEYRDYIPDDPTDYDSDKRPKPAETVPPD